MKRFLLFLCVSLIVSLLCQCSTYTIEVERPTPPRLGDAAPRPGQSIGVYGYPQVRGLTYMIRNRLDKWGTLEVGTTDIQDYVVHIDKPTEVGKLTTVSIWRGRFLSRPTIPSSFNLRSCMTCIASKTMVAGSLFERHIADWAVEQLIPTMRTYSFTVDYADKPDLEIAARCIQKGAYEDVYKVLYDHWSKHPNDPEACYVGGILAVYGNEYDMAQKFFNKAYFLKPEEKYRKAASDCSTIVSDAARVQPFVR